MELTFFSSTMADRPKFYPNALIAVCLSICLSVCRFVRFMSICTRFEWNDVCHRANKRIQPELDLLLFLFFTEYKLIYFLCGTKVQNMRKCNAREFESHVAIMSLFTLLLTHSLCSKIDKCPKNNDRWRCVWTASSELPTKYSKWIHTDWNNSHLPLAIYSVVTKCHAGCLPQSISSWVFADVLKRLFLEARTFES